MMLNIKWGGENAESQDVNSGSKANEGVENKPWWAILGLNQ